MIKLLDSEKNFFVHINEIIEKVEKNGKIVLSKFLTLREQEVIKYLTKNRIEIEFYGGYSFSERKRCLFYPKDVNIKPEHNITCFKISYPKRFLELRHQNVLGTLMSLQIDRSLFGDIIIDYPDSFLFVAKEIEDIVKMDFTAINNVPITLEVYDDELIYEPKYKIKEIIVSSMRIDNIISNVYNLSREKAKQYILANFVYQNFQLNVNPSSKCEIEDIISLRKYGRFIISRLLRKTKNNKFVLEIKIPT